MDWQQVSVVTIGVFLGGLALQTVDAIISVLMEDAGNDEDDEGGDDS